MAIAAELDRAAFSVQMLCSLMISQRQTRFAYRCSRHLRTRWAIDGSLFYAPCGAYRTSCPMLPDIACVQIFSAMTMSGDILFIRVEIGISRVRHEPQPFKLLVTTHGTLPNSICQSLTSRQVDRVHVSCLQGKCRAAALCSALMYRKIGCRFRLCAERGLREWIGHSSRMTRLKCAQFPLHHYYSPQINYHRYHWFSSLIDKYISKIVPKFAIVAKT